MKRFFRENVLRLSFGLAAVLLILTAAFAQAPSDSQFTIWRFDSVDVIGGHPAHVLGHPHVIDSPYGKAVAFNGVDDALFVDVHPLSGASQYTWEVIFRPDADGAQAQRFFHLSELDPATGKDTNNRMLFEIRIVKGQWCLDSFAFSNGSARTLLNCDDLHPLGQWYRVTAVYDGKMLRNYVGDEMQGEGELHLTPQGAGTLVHRNAHRPARLLQGRGVRGAVHAARAQAGRVPEDAAGGETVISGQWSVVSVFSLRD